MSLWFEEKTLACDCLIKYICCCRLWSKLGWRPTYPSDPWFVPVKLTFQVPQIALDYDGPRKRLAFDSVAERIRLHCGEFKTFCSGFKDPCASYDLVVDVKTDTQAATAVLSVLPGTEDTVRSQMRSLTDIKGNPIEVFEALS